jgi:hypothetical protein
MGLFKLPRNSNQDCRVRLHAITPPGEIRQSGPTRVNVYSFIYL